MSQLSLRAHQAPIGLGWNLFALEGTNESALSPGAIELDRFRVMARKEQIIRRTDAAGTKQRYRQTGMALFEGMAAFENIHKILLEEQVLYGDKIMVATGSKPAWPAMTGLNESQPIISVEAISLLKPPTSLTILRAGPVGCECAQLSLAFDLRVTLL